MFFSSPSSFSPLPPRSRAPLSRCRRPRVGSVTIFFGARLLAAIVLLFPFFTPQIVIKYRLFAIVGRRKEKKAQRLAKMEERKREGDMRVDWKRTRKQKKSETRRRASCLARCRECLSCASFALRSDDKNIDELVESNKGIKESWRCESRSANGEDDGRRENGKALERGRFFRRRPRKSKLLYSAA